MTKLDPSGAALVYSTYLGGSGGEYAYGIAVDGSGSAYVTGYTTRPTSRRLPGAFDTTLDGGADAFVTKLDAERRGPRLLHLPGRKRRRGRPRHRGGRRRQRLRHRETSSTDFPTTAGAFDTTLDGDGDAFVTKLDASGAALVYSTYLGGSSRRGRRRDRGRRRGQRLRDAAARRSADFPTTPGAFDTTLDGGVDAFVTKLDASGAALVYSTYLGGRTATTASPASRSTAPATPT